MLLYYYGDAGRLQLFVSVWHESCQCAPMWDWVFCQNQHAGLLCQPSSVWSLNPSWKPPALLSKPTEAGWDYMCGYYPHHPPLHHWRWVVEGISRTRTNQRLLSYTQTRHGSCCTSLKNRLMTSFGLLRDWMQEWSHEKKRVNRGNSRSTGLRLKGVCHIPMVGLEAHLSDKEGSNGIRQGGTRVKCLGSIWLECWAPEGWLASFKKETLKGLLTLFVVYSKHTIQAQLDRDYPERLAVVTGPS